MYVIDHHDSIATLRDVPPPDVGAPLPAVLASETELDLVYLVSEPDPHWDGSYAATVAVDSEGKPVARVRFQNPYAHMFGPPNDEAFSGHPLASRGLAPYAAWEVRASSWIRQLARMNAVHPSHDPKRFERYRHFIFAFHDTTFECIAASYVITIERGSVASVAAAVPALWP